MAVGSMAVFCVRLSQEYEALGELGTETSTDEPGGHVLKQAPYGTPWKVSLIETGPNSRVPRVLSDHVTEAALRAALDKFRGDTFQVPPRYVSRAGCVLGCCMLRAL